MVAYQAVDTGCRLKTVQKFGTRYQPLAAVLIVIKHEKGKRQGPVHAHGPGTAGAATCRGLFLHPLARGHVLVGVFEQHPKFTAVLRTKRQSDRGTAGKPGLFGRDTVQCL